MSNTIDQLSALKPSAVQIGVQETAKETAAVTAEELAGLLSPELSAAQREIHALKADIEFHKNERAELLQTIDAYEASNERLNLRLELAANMYDSLDAQNATLKRAVALLERKVVLSDFAAVSANNTIASLLKLLGPVIPNVNALNICDLLADMLSVLDGRFSEAVKAKSFWAKLAEEAENHDRLVAQEAKRLTELGAEGQTLMDKGV